MNVGRTDLAVVLPARTACHQRVAEIDQTAGRDVREEDGLLEAHRVSPVRFLLQQGPRPNLRSAAHVRLIQENRTGVVAAFQSNPGAELTVLDRCRCLRPEHTPRPDRGLCAEDLASGVNDHARRDTLDIEVSTYLHGGRTGNDDPTTQEGLDDVRHDQLLPPVFALLCCLTLTGHTRVSDSLQLRGLPSPGCPFKSLQDLHRRISFPYLDRMMPFLLEPIAKDPKLA